LITSSGLRSLKSRESMSVENTPILQHHAAEALPELFRKLQADGYKVVHMVPKGEVATVPKYDEMLAHKDALSSNNTRPESSVIRTIGE
jgi:hypothetical protein